MKRLNKTIGLIGCGNMGSAILNGIISNKLVPPKQIFVFDQDLKKAKQIAKKFKVNCVSSNQELIQRAQIVLLAIKPQDLQALSTEIAHLLNAKHILISILAGTPVEKLKTLLETSPHPPLSLGERVGVRGIVRAMPNLGAQVGASITAITGSNPGALKQAKAIFECCGTVVVLEENFFNLVTALSGSGPAYFFLLMELLINYGMSQGLSEKQAAQLATQTALGAAKLALNSQGSPRELRQAVTSQKGTTAAALEYLEQHEFGRIFAEALERARLRAEELSQ